MARQLALSVPEFGDVYIDENLLDIDQDHPVAEFAQFPQVLWMYTDNLARLSSFNELGRYKLERLKAAKQIEFRNSPPAGIKPTEELYKAWVTVDKDVQTVAIAYHKATEVEERLKAFCKALEKKFTSMERIAMLSTRGI